LILKAWFDVDIGEDEDIEAFKTLRLTLLQAKVYLAIVRLKEAKIREISKSVKVARQDIYRVVAELQELGLVEKVIATPCRYEAVPIRQAAFILLKRIQDDDVESQEKAMTLIERHKKQHEAKTL
jgi:sugar-specific transcriptional regulator TrmB